MINSLCVTNDVFIFVKWYLAFLPRQARDKHTREPAYLYQA
eukprot:COSAG06_NODE_35669_length_457_cov_0.731844_1_plen_40_part_01